MMRCLQEDFTRGRIFHVFNHVIDNYLLFYDEEDYDYFLQIFTCRINKIPAGIFSYCLMPNHYHFLIRQESDNKLYKLFNYCFISYARYFNKRYDRKGPIFRSPLQHKIADTKAYVIKLSKYIHLNPVFANLADKPENWPYSNYLDWINKRNSELLVPDVHQVYFPDPKKYIRFVESPNFRYKE
jgi:putative transposase